MGVVHLRVVRLARGFGQTPSPGRQTPPPQEGKPPVNRMTDSCKNITFVPLLRNAVGKNCMNVKKSCGVVHLDLTIYRFQ